MPTSIRAALAQIGILKFKKPLVQQLGVGATADLPWLLASDLAEIGMPPQKQEKLLELAAHIPREVTKVDAEKRLFPGDGAVMSVLRQVRMLRARERFIGTGPTQLRVKSIRQMQALSDEQMRNAGFKAVTRRRFLAAMQTIDPSSLGGTSR